MNDLNGMSKQAAAELIAWIKERYEPLDTLSAKEIGKLFRTPEKTIDYKARSNQIPFIQSGRHIRFSPLALIFWIIQKHGAAYLKPGERGGSDETPE